jgi:DNA-directed RNA polymerase specialized sigma24 family protein
MSSSGSVTACIDQLRAGDRAAAQRLWQGYFHRLIGLARKKLRRAPRGMAGAEDVALSALDSFFRGAEQGRFLQLHDRDDLWRLLLVITERKAIDLINHERAQKRGGGNVRHEGSLAGDSSVTAPFDHVASPEPTPELAAQFADECRRLLDALGDETLRAVALAKMEGCTNKAIAERLRCSVPTIERKLNRIRRTWGGRQDDERG